MSEGKIDLQRIRNADRPAGQAQLWLDASQIVGRQGDAEAARRLARAAADADPGCVEAWLRLADLTDEPAEQEACLRRVLDLEPGQVQAQAALARLQRPAAADALPAETRPESGRAARKGASSATRHWTLAGLLLVAVLFLGAVLVWGPVESSAAWLLPSAFASATPAPTPTPTRTPSDIAGDFVPQLQAALSQQNWDRALRIVDIMLSLDPEAAEVRQWGGRAYLEYGQATVRRGQPSTGLAHLDRAVALDPNNAEAGLWQDLTSAYLAGQQALKAGDWDAAVDRLTHVHEGLPSFLDELDLLTRAYRQRGIANQEAGELQAARSDLEAALALQPDDAEAKAHLDQVMLELFPPKRIEVNLSNQHFYAWEGDQLIYSFATSTGLPGRDTAPGHFKVLDKIPNAYSSIWRLQMPYWLGIYYVGTVENGIHALPIRPDGTVMWGGLLGTRQSYGCIILGTEAARLVYEWAEVGTAVDIHY